MQTKVRTIIHRPQVAERKKNKTPMHFSVVDFPGKHCTANVSPSEMSLLKNHAFFVQS